MIAYTIRRFLQLIPVLFGMSVIIFSIVRFIPGDPARTILGPKATEESIQHLRDNLGLDQSYVVQYFKYLGDVLSGNFGTSITTGNQISNEIWGVLSATAELTVVAMVLAVVVGLNAGILSAWFQNTWLDYILMVLVLIGISVPVFWLGLIFQWQFALEWEWFPTIGRENIRNPIDPITNFLLIDALIHGNFSQFITAVKHLLLPAVTLGTIPMAIIARMTRSSMLDVMRSDYIRTARSKGQKMFWVVYKHALKNAFIPVLTVIGLQCGFLLGGAVLTETIFGWPGIGRYVYDAILARDYPVVQSGILVIALIFVVINLIVDLLYAAFDPRINYQ